MRRRAEGILPARGTGRPSRRTPVDRLRAICLALPETIEKVAWGEPTWRVRGRLFFRPPYVGHRGWVGVRIDRRPDWTVVAKLVEQAYREVAPPRLGEAARAGRDTSEGLRRTRRGRTSRCE